VAAPSGYLALAVYDATRWGGNSDGIIDSSDPIYARLRLWQDTNHNGVSETSELKTLSSLGVTALALSYTESLRNDAAGNLFHNVSVAYQGGVTRTTYDVFLVSEP
jgi:hypothetical protein